MTRRHAFLLVAIALFFLSFHSYRLLTFPPFADESAYMFWSSMIITRGNVTQPLRDGTGPVFMLLSLPLIAISKNYLLAGRLVSILSNFVSLILIWNLTFWLTKSSKSALLSAIFWASFPIVFVQGRLAVLDPLTTMWILLSVNAVLRGDNKYWQDVLILALSLTAGFLTKPTTVTVIPFLLQLPFLVKTKKTLSLSHIILGICLASISCLIIFFPFRTAFLQLYNNYYKHSSDAFSSIINVTIANFRKQLRWLYSYATFIGAITLVGGILISVKKSIVTRLSLIWITLTLTANALVGTNNIFPRHIYQIFPALSILLSHLVFRIRQQNMLLKFVVISILLGSFFSFTLHFISSPQTAPLPREDVYQLFEDWTSGYGLRESAQALQLLMKNGKSTLLADDKWFAHGLHLFYGIDDNSIDIREDLYFDPQPKSLEDEGRNPSYLILNRQRNPSPEWKLAKYWSYDIPPRKSIAIYKILPK